MCSSLGLYHRRHLASQGTRGKEQRNLKRHCVHSISICLPPPPPRTARHRKRQWLRSSQYRVTGHPTLAQVPYTDHHHKLHSSYQARNPVHGHLWVQGPPRPTTDTMQGFHRLSHLPLPPRLDCLNQTSQTNIPMRPHHQAAYH